jgi:hypothetical protein
MSTRFKNNTDDDLVLFGPTGHPDAYICPAGEIVEVRGDITDETDDAFIVGSGDDARAWPKSLWRVTKSETRTRARTGSDDAGADSGADTDSEE